MLGAVITELREGAGLTKEALAENAGVSLMTIYRIELYGADATTRMLEKIAKALGTTGGNILTVSARRDAAEARRRKRKRAKAQ